MTAAALVRFPLESGRTLAERLRQPLSLKAALWLYLDDDSWGGWRRLLASLLVDEKGPRAAYNVVRQYWRGKGGLDDLSLNSVTVTSPNDPVIKPIIVGLGGEGLGKGRRF